ncbi:MAG: D-glycero-beta-D-manno-heptose 1,7-bisphosphate 7-phosphatase [Gammaproteobacteria bacterium]
MTVIVLDRDGVINHDSDDYIKSPDEFEPIDGSLDAIALLSNNGFRLAVATNQSGLARGLFDHYQLARIHQKLLSAVEQQGGYIEGIFFCPHGPEEGCNCRKPRTGLIEQVENEFGESVLGCYLVGDSLRDLQAASTYGCVPVLVRTGNGKITEQELADKALGDVQVFDDLLAFARTLVP